jgi:hypothetical protein
MYGAAGNHFFFNNMGIMRYMLVLNDYCPSESSRGTETDENYPWLVVISFDIDNEWKVCLANFRRNCCTAQEDCNRASLAEQKPVEKLQLRAYLEQSWQQRKKMDTLQMMDWQLKNMLRLQGSGSGCPLTLIRNCCFPLLCLPTPSIL